VDSDRHFDDKDVQKVREKEKEEKKKKFREIVIILK